MEGETAADYDAAVATALRVTESAALPSSGNLPMGRHSQAGGYGGRARPVVTNNFACHECGQEFDHFSSLIHHKSVRHAKEIEQVVIQCVFCPFEGPKDSLRRHNLSHL